MDDFCWNCNGLGKMIIIEHDLPIEVDCDECDGTGLTEEYETFQKRRPKRHRFDEE